MKKNKGMRQTIKWLVALNAGAAILLFGVLCFGMLTVNFPFWLIVIDVFLIWLNVKFVEAHLERLKRLETTQ